MSHSESLNGVVPQQYTGAFAIPFGKRVKFYIDNHRISTFTTCPRLFEYTQIDNWRPKSTGQALSIGAWWSRVLELTYREMSFGTLPTLEQCSKFAADAWIEMQMDTALPERALNRFGGKEGALLMIMQYYNNYLERDFQNWKIIGTEVGFGLKDEVVVGEDDEVIVCLTGKPDFIVYEYGLGQVVIGDHKTVDYVKGNTLISYKPHPQTAGYVYAAQQIAKSLNIDARSTTDRCIISISARMKPSEKPRDGKPKPRFIRAYPNYTQAEIDEWRSELMQKCRELKSALTSKTFIKHENSCHIYGGCSFRRVCSVPPGARPIILKADFRQVDAWVPYDPEESTDSDD